MPSICPFFEILDLLLLGVLIDNHPLMVEIVKPLMDLASSNQLVAGGKVRLPLTHGTLNRLASNLLFSFRV